MNCKKSRAWKRRGVTAFQTSFVIAVIGIGIIAGGSLVGQNTKSDMENLSSEVANPAELSARFSGDCGECTQ